MNIFCAKPVKNLKVFKKIIPETIFILYRKWLMIIGMAPNLMPFADNFLYKRRIHFSILTYHEKGGFGLSAVKKVKELIYHFGQPFLIFQSIRNKASYIFKIN